MLEEKIKNNPQKCPECLYEITDNKINLKHHIVAEHGYGYHTILEERYNQKIKSIIVGNVVLKYTLPSLVNENFICDICDQIYTSIDLLQKHRIEFHKIEIHEVVQKDENVQQHTHQCNICRHSRAFSTAIGLKAHSSIVHKKLKICCSEI